MATKRRSLEDRIKDRLVKVEAEQKALAQLQAIADRAPERSEWVDRMFTEFGVEPQAKDPGEQHRLARLRAAMAAPAAEMEKVRAERAQLRRTVLAMAKELGVHGDEGAVWQQVRQRFGTQ